jgi:clan AA aspartic protease
MGTTYEEITLKNDGDKIRVECGYIKEPEIRQATVRALVDTGAGTLVINEEVRNQLGLMILGQREAELANGEKELCKITETVEVLWKDRSMTCRAWLIPNAKEVLLGAIPLEDMDLMVDTVGQKLVGRHGDKPEGMVM